MPVLIKNVDPDLYTKFKARAIERGLKIDEAFNEAITVWLQTPRDITPRDKLQRKNELAYQLLRNTLEKECLNKWVAIIDGQLALTTETRELLFQELAHIKKNDEPALVFQVKSVKERRTLGFKSIHRKNIP